MKLPQLLFHKNITTKSSLNLIFKYLTKYYFILLLRKLTNFIYSKYYFNKSMFYVKCITNESITKYPINS